MNKPCKFNPEFCSGQATEANGMCFMCAEEMAGLIFDAYEEFGQPPAAAAAAAQASWNGA